MKKIILLILVMAGSMLAIPKTTIKANEIEDQKIGIVITKDGNTVSINHTSDITIQKAVVEYAFYDNGVYISMLDTFDVSNNRLTINKGVTTAAVKVHQVLTLRGNLWYRYATTNQNTAGSFTGVNRMNIVEIETTHIETIKTDILTTAKIASPRYKYYNFYFDFEKEHDELIMLDVDYIIHEYTFFGLIKSKSHNVSDNINVNENIVMSGYVQTQLPGTTTIIFPRQSTSVKSLEANTTSNPGNYVARVSADLGWLSDDFKIENFAILKVGYMIDGDFILDDVINDPTTPIDDINDLIAVINNIKKVLGDFMGFITSIANFFTSNGSTVLKVIVGIIALILLGPIFTVIKFIFTIIKYIFKIPGQLLNTLKVLFVPGYKNERKR